MLFIQRNEIPDGGRYSENIMAFDINPQFMSDVILIHGQIYYVIVRRINII